MFDIGMTELLVIAVVAIIVVGPKDLPGLLRNGAKYIGQIRNLARDFQGQVDSAIRDSELKESMSDLTNIDPLKDVKSDIDDYMDSARAFDEPDEEYIQEGEKLAKQGEAIDGGVPEETVAQVEEKPADKPRAKKKAAPKKKAS